MKFFDTGGIFELLVIPSLYEDINDSCSKPTLLKGTILISAPDIALAIIVFIISEYFALKELKNTIKFSYIYKIYPGLKFPLEI